MNERTECTLINGLKDTAMKFGDVKSADDHPVIPSEIAVALPTFGRVSRAGIVPP